MAVVQPMVMTTNGWSRQMDPTQAGQQDSLESYGLAMINSQKITGVGASTTAGDVVVYGQASASLDGLTLTSNDLVMGSNKITGLANGTATNDGVNFGQLQDVVSNISWKEPVAALQVTDEADTDPGAVGAGLTYMVTTDWGAYSIGDCVQRNSADTGWVLIAANNAGDPETDLRLLNNSGGSVTLGGVSISDDHIAEYNGTTWTDVEAPEDGDTFLVYANNALFEDSRWSFDGTVWLQTGGAGYYSGGDGVSIIGTSVAVDLVTNSGLKFTAGELEADLGNGLELNGNSIQADLNAAGGLEFSGSDIGINVDSTGSATTSINGSNELVVSGLPSLYTINGTAVGATVTAPNMDTLTDGSNADSLHIHASAAATNVINGLTAGTGGVSAGDPVYISGNDEVLPSDAGTLNTTNVVGIVTADAIATATANVFNAGIATITGASFTANEQQFLANGGGLTTTRPTTSGDRIIQLGFAVNTTDLSWNYMDFGRLA